MNLTINEFLERLSSHKGSIICVITSKTIPKLRKEHPFTEAIRHIHMQEVALGAIYENSVNRARAKEGLTEYFYAEALWGGKGRRKTPYTYEHIDTHKEYFAVRPIRSIESFYMDGSKEYKDEDVTPYLQRQGVATKQGLNKPVPWRTLSIENLRMCKVFGETINIIPGELYADSKA